MVRFRIAHQGATCPLIGNSLSSIPRRPTIDEPCWSRAGTPSGQRKVLVTVNQNLHSEPVSCGCFPQSSTLLSILNPQPNSLSETLIHTCSVLSTPMQSPRLSCSWPSCVEGVALNAECDWRPFCRRTRCGGQEQSNIGALQKKD